MGAIGWRPMVLNEAVLVQWEIVDWQRFLDFSDLASLEHQVSFITVVLKLRDCNCYPNSHQSSSLHLDGSMEGQTLASPIQWGRLRNNGTAGSLSIPQRSDEAMQEVVCVSPNSISSPSLLTNAYSSNECLSKGHTWLPRKVVFPSPELLRHLFTSVISLQTHCELLEGKDFILFISLSPAPKTVPVI